MAESTQVVNAQKGEENNYGLEPDVEKQLREVFTAFDESSDGKIDAKELSQILEAVTGQMQDIGDIETMIASVDEGGDGAIQLPEFLNLVSEQMKTKKRDEVVVELFKSFGADDVGGVITVGMLDKALKEGGDSMKDSELNMLFEEIAGQTKRPQLSAERRYVRSQGISFHDFLLLLLPK